MNDYYVYYTCPCCPDPCVPGGEMEEANEGIVADSKTEARRIFNHSKQCRLMKVTRIVEDGKGPTSRQRRSINDIPHKWRWAWGCIEIDEDNSNFRRNCHYSVIHYSNDPRYSHYIWYKHHTYYMTLEDWNNA